MVFLTVSWGAASSNTSTQQESMLELRLRTEAQSWLYADVLEFDRKNLLREGTVFTAVKSIMLVLGVNGCFMMC